MTAAPIDLTVFAENGATFVQVLIWEDPAGVPIDLTGYTARAQVRPVPASDRVLLSVSSPSSGIVLGGVAGTVTLTFSAAQTAALPHGRVGVWDLLLTSPTGIVTRLAEGAVSCSLSVTR